MAHSDDLAAIGAALGCAPDAAAALHQHGAMRDAPGGTVLAHQGDAITHNWLILDGAVRCEVISPDGRASVVATHPPGDMIGAFGRRSTDMLTSLVTYGSTQLLAVSVTMIERLGGADGDFAMAIARSYATQSHVMVDRLAVRISLTAVGRIYARLLDMADGDGAITPAPVIAALAVSVQTTRETASRAISGLERRGIISRTGSRMVINSPRMLEELVV